MPVCACVPMYVCMFKIWSIYLSDFFKLYLFWSFNNILFMVRKHYFSKTYDFQGLQQYKSIIHKSVIQCKWCKYKFDRSIVLIISLIANRITLLRTWQMCFMTQNTSQTILRPFLSAWVPNTGSDANNQGSSETCSPESEAPRYQLLKNGWWKWTVWGLRGSWCQWQRGFMCGRKIWIVLRSFWRSMSENIMILTCNQKDMDRKKGWRRREKEASENSKRLKSGGDKVVYQHTAETEQNAH